jgi:hypothetical protein
VPVGGQRMGDAGRYAGFHGWLGILGQDGSHRTCQMCHE